jgi:nitrite reductase/ring-hydroxylating ferredoxin subunit
MDVANKEFAFAGSLDELKAKGRLVLHGDHRPILVVYDRGRVFALDNRCPHMGFPLERGSVEDGNMHKRIFKYCGVGQSVRIRISLTT